MHARFAMIPTAVESVSTFEHTDQAFRADAPPLAATEPALAFVRAPRRRLRPTTRQYHSADAAARRGLFVGRRAEAPIAGGEIWCASEDRLVPIQCRGPQVTSAGRFAWTAYAVMI